MEPHIQEHWERLSPRERDVLIARRVMRWGVDERYVTDSRGRLMYFTDELPALSTDHAAARLVEDEISLLDLYAEYVAALVAVVAPEADLESTDVIWSVIRATPEERCRAALIAVDSL